MNALEEEKQQIRKFIKACKAKLTIEEIRLCSQLILKNIESLPAFQKAETLMAYWALPDEVQNHDFILRWYQHKKLCTSRKNRACHRSRNSVRYLKQSPWTWEGLL